MSLLNGSAETRSLDRSPMAYGLISTRRDAGGASRPTIAACSDERKCPLLMNAGGTGVRYDTSFFQRFVRRAWKPQTCSRPGR